MGRANGLAAVTSHPPLPDAVWVREGDLPAGALNLVRLLGWPDASALIHTLGGIAFPVPVAANNNPAGAARFAQLAEIVGEAGAQAIIAEYGGDILNIPNCRQAIARARMRAMRDRYDQGARAEDVALEFRCSVRWVYYAMKVADSEYGAELALPAQGALF